MEVLKSSGHSDPLSYTPRQAAVWAEQASSRMRAERAQQMLALRAAFNAENDDFNKILKELEP